MIFAVRFESSLSEARDLRSTMNEIIFCKLTSFSPSFLILTTVVCVCGGEHVYVYVFIFLLICNPLAMLDDLKEL